ncbi:MAG: ATP-binding cassette domain-containing protein [Alphaproteobacteria bacterium]
MPPLLQIHDLCVSLPKDAPRPRALSNINLNLHSGETLAILGPSGAGKSILARAIIGLLPKGIQQIGGTIRFNNQTLKGENNFAPLRNTKIAWLPQDPDAALSPYLSAEKQLLAGASSLSAQNRRQQFQNYAQKLNLKPRHLKAFPHQLSGGERARLLTAACLATKPQLLLADEPSAAIDAATLVEILAVLKQAQQNDTLATILITHDPGVAQTCTRVLILDEGQTVQGGSLNQLKAIPPLATATPPHNHTKPRTKLHASKLVFLTPRSATPAGPATPATPIVQVDDFSLAAGESVALLGISGAGKSSFAQLLANLIKPSSGLLQLGDLQMSRPQVGRVQVGRAQKNHHKNREWHKRVQYVAQDPWRSLHPQQRVINSVRLAASVEKQSNTRRSNARNARTRASELLEETGLKPEHAQRFPHQLSGGERQRVALARALASAPDFLLADEITSALDSVTAVRILDLLKDLVRNHGLGLLLITHDLRLAVNLCERILVMDAGRLVENQQLSAFLEAPLSASGGRLLGAARSLGKGLGEGLGKGLDDNANQ